MTSSARQVLLAVALIVVVGTATVAWFRVNEVDRRLNPAERELERRLRAPLVFGADLLANPKQPVLDQRKVVGTLQVEREDAVRGSWMIAGLGLFAGLVLVGVARKS